MSVALSMDQLTAVGDRLYARDQWGRVWRLRDDTLAGPEGLVVEWRWELTPAPPGTVWADPHGLDAVPSGTLLATDDPRR